MTIEEIRKHLETTSIFDLELRVVFFIRIPADSSNLPTPIGNQIGSLEDYIVQHPSWIYMGGHLDLGVYTSTSRVDNGFKRMINAAEAGKFDLIITQNISDFGINTLESIRYAQRLLKSGVGVYFLEEGICSLDEDSDLQLNIMAEIAQDKLRSLTSRVRFGHKEYFDQKAIQKLFS